MLQKRELREVIRNASGNVIARSANLAGIRRYVGKHIIKMMAIDRQLPSSAGTLLILFDNGSSFQTNFASHNILCDFVRRWRNVYGAPLLLDGLPSGKVSKDNPRDSDGKLF